MIGRGGGMATPARTAVCVGLAIQREAFWLEKGPVVSPPAEPKLPLSEAIRQFCMASKDRKTLVPIVRALARQLSRLADELDA